MSVKPRCVFNWEHNEHLINGDDPYWWGYYDAEQPGTVARPFIASAHYTDLEDRRRWRAGAMAYFRQNREAA